VIGVNTSIISPNGAYAGIGFAIPADVANAISKQLIANGSVARGYLGVTITSLSDDIAQSLSLKDKAGAYVTDVTPGGPSDRGGVRVGDVVLKLDGKPVKDNTELTRRVAMARAGDVLTLDVLRSGKMITLKVKSGVRPTEQELAERGQPKGDDSAPVAPAPSAPEVLGLGVAPIDAATRQTYGLPARTEGMVITKVAPHTPAARRGLQAGYVIVMADNRPVTSLGEFQATVNAVKASGRPSVLLLVQAKGQNVPVAIPFEEPKK
jgi:serine protease Do